MSSLRRVVGILLAIPAVGLALVSAAAWAGAWDWRLDLVANGRVLLWWAAGLLLVGAVAVRSHTATAAAAITVVLNLAPIVPLYLPSAADVPANDPTTVLSFNLLSTNDRYDEVVDYIVRSGADVVFLHEGTLLWEEALAARDLPYEMVSGRDEALIFGTIALVPTDAEVTNLGFASSQGRGLAVRWGGLEILGVHPLAPVDARSAELHRAQHRAYGEWASARDRAVVVGDFNSTPWTSTFRSLVGDGGLLNSQRGYGVAPTWEVGRLWALPIDHLVHTGDLVVVDRVVGPDLGSDHRPLLVEVAPRS